MQYRYRHTQKVFADKQGFPDNRAPLVQRGLAHANVSLYAATLETWGKACGQGVARVEEPPRLVQLLDATVL